MYRIIVKIYFFEVEVIGISKWQKYFNRLSGCFESEEF